MPRIKTEKYNRLRSLEDERKLSKWSAIQGLKKKSKFFDVTGDIPGTLPEKMIYNYLLKLHVNFEYQYHMPESAGTLNPESNWIPDFLLPDYNNTLIEVYGTYWHRLNRTSDQLKKTYWLLDGYTVYEKGVPTRPASGRANGGKVIIWWEYEIYGGIDALVSRDFPELQRQIIKGDVASYLLDKEKEKVDLSIMRARMKSTRIRPKFVPARARYRKLVKKKYG